MQKASRSISPGRRNPSPRTAIDWRRTRARDPAHQGRRPRATDGPYSETKEVLGGYYTIEAANYDEAVKLALEHPSSNTAAPSRYGKFGGRERRSRELASCWSICSGTRRAEWWRTSRACSAPRIWSWPKRPCRRPCCGLSRLGPITGVPENARRMAFSRRPQFGHRCDPPRPPHR